MKMKRLISIVWSQEPIPFSDNRWRWAVKVNNQWFFLMEFDF